MSPERRGKSRTLRSRWSLRWRKLSGHRKGDPAADGSVRVPAGFRQVLEFRDFELSDVPRSLHRHGRTVHLGPQPLKLLWLLAARAGETVTRSEIREHLWGQDTYVDFDRNINVTVQKLRKALASADPEGEFIETVPGQGYRFVARIESSPASPMRAPRRPTLAVLAGLGAVAGLAAIAIWGWVAQPASSDGPSQPITAEELSSFPEARRLVGSRDERERARGRMILADLGRAGYVPAHLALAEAYYSLRWSRLPIDEVAQPMQFYAEQAASAKPDSGLAQRILGYHAFRYQLDPRKALPFARSALALEPGDPENWGLYGMIMLALADHSKALESYEAAVQANQHDRGLKSDAAYAAFLAGDYRAALSWAEASESPGSMFSATIEIDSLLALSEESSALGVARRLADRIGMAQPTSLEQWYTLLLARMRSMEDSGIRVASEMSVLHHRLGRPLEARSALAEACEARSGWSLPFLRVDPRFIEILDEMNWPDGEACPSLRQLGV